MYHIGYWECIYGGFLGLLVGRAVYQVNVLIVADWSTVASYHIPLSIPFIATLFIHHVNFVAHLSLEFDCWVDALFGTGRLAN